jgi:polysaccharide export outer membrane protein
VSLPLAGTMRAAGRTRAGLEREITRRYGDKLQEPQVTVEVVEFRPFYVMGEVLTPGTYPYRSGLNVLTATTTAGGLTYRASRQTVLIQHPGEEVWREYPMTASVLVSPGDLIRVPERYF